MEIVKLESRRLKQFLPFFAETISTLFAYQPNSIRFYLEYDYEEKWLRKQLRVGRKKIYVAEDNGIIVGYILFSEPDGGVSFVDWLAVDPVYQNRGIASKLLKISQEETVKSGGHNSYLWTSKETVTFYEKKGYTLSGVFPKSWHGHDHYLLYKILAEPKEENYLRNFLK